MIITIDGPAGSGKSTVAELVSRKLGFFYLKTGLMYRAVALAGMRAGVKWENPAELARVARQMNMSFDGARVFLDDEDISLEVESLPVTAVTKYSAGNAEVREILNEIQQEFVKGRDCVTEGRDQGTLVFPDAQWKFYLDASARERARRRFQQKTQLGEPADYDEILRGIIIRDAEDSGREIAPLKPADDAVMILSDGMTAEEVAEKIVETVNE